MLRKLMLLGSLLVLAGSVAAQVLQTGTVTQGHLAIWQYKNVISDGGVNIFSSAGSVSPHNFLGNNTTSTAAAKFVQPSCADLSNSAKSCSTDATNASNLNPATHTPANFCGAPTDDTTDASTAINTCITDAALGGWTLYIDQPYKVAAQVQLQSNLTIFFLSGGRIDQNFSPSGVGGVVSQANRSGGAITNLHIYNLNVQGDCTYVLGGNLVSLWLQNSVVYGSTTNCFQGRSYLVNLQNTTWYNATGYNPQPNSGAGGFRCGICQNSYVIGGYIDSGDDTWQFVPGAGSTQDTFNSGYIGVGGSSATARAFVIAPGSSNRSITDVRYSEAGGGQMGGNGNGISIGNGGTGKVTNVTVGPATVNESNDYFQQQVISLSGSASSPIGLVTFNDVRVISPFKRCINGTQYTKYLNINRMICEKPHLNLIGTVGSTASAGATTVTVPAYICSLMQTNDTLEIVLDDSVPTNGSYAGKAQNISGANSCSGTTLTIATALLGQASAGANIYDYTDSFQPTIATVTSGNSCLTFRGVGIYNTSDNVALAYDDGTALSTTILSVNGSTNQVCLNANLTKTSSAGAIFADRSYQGYDGNLLEGVMAGKIADSVFYGANNNVMDLGKISDPPGTTNLDSDLVFDNDTLKDIAPGQVGYSRSFCDNCTIRGGQLFATAGASPNAISDNASVPSFTTTLSGNITNNQTTVPLASATALPPYKHSFYILIDSEIMLATGGGNATLQVQRAMLGTSAASHNSGATVSIDQAGVTESPVDGIDIGDFADQFCGGAVGTYAIGQGNWFTGWKGCENQTKITSAAAFPYTDQFGSQNGVDVWRVSGSTNPTSLSIPSPPPFKSARIDFYDQGGSNLTMPNTATFIECGGAAYTLHSGNTVPYRFDATSQKLTPICANTP